MSWYGLPIAPMFVTRIANAPAVSVGPRFSTSSTACAGRAAQESTAAASHAARRLERRGDTGLRRIAGGRRTSPFEDTERRRGETRDRPLLPPAGRVTPPAPASHLSITNRPTWWPADESTVNRYTPDAVSCPLREIRSQRAWPSPCVPS